MPLKSELHSDQGLVAMGLRRWRTMAVAFTVVVATGAVVVQAMPRAYEASAKVLIMRTDQRLGGLNVMNDTLPELTNLTNPLHTQVELLRIYPVFASAIARLDLRDEAGRPLDAQALARRLKVGPVGKTDLIGVSYTGPDPEEARRVVQAVCEAYLQQGDRHRREGVADGLKLVDDQLETARKRLVKAESALLAFKRRSGSVALNEEISASVGELSALNTQLRERQIELARVSARAANLRAQLGMSSAEAMQAAAIGENPRVQALQRQLTEAEASPLKSQGLGPRHPELVALNHRIASLKRAIAEAVRAQVGHPAPAGTLDEIRLGLLRELAAAEAEIAAGRSSLNAARGRRKALTASMTRFPGQQVTLTRLNREVTVASEIYQQLLQKREEARLAMAIAPTSARVIEPAVLPTRPVAPLKGPTGPVLVLMGLAAAFAAGALKDLLDRTASPHDLAGYVQALQIYAAVPTLSRHERRAGELLVGTPQAPHYVEAVKTLALTLEEHLGGVAGSVIGLSSTTAREGKSVTLANLALALAEAGHRVLLVDSDFRRPRVGPLFGFTDGRGLSDVLMEQARPAEVVRRAGSIDVVTAGQAKLAAGGATIRHRLAPALAAWKLEYDFVLLDMPPLLVLSEVAQAARHTDGVLMLANLHQVPPDALLAGVQQLQSLRAPVIGLVAISQMVAQSKGGYYLLAGEGLIS
jgi:uncharacterized protein involved in exopolysaccharide biosynthesis/Mrp family chromosome partitioning ATPase